MGEKEIIKEKDLIYDWNNPDGVPPSRLTRIELDDETLRDGLQSPSVMNPPIEEKIKILHLMAQLGIDSVDIGLPGAGKRPKEDAVRLAREIVEQKLGLFPNCAARTLRVDIEPIIETSQQAGLPIEVAVFIGSSPIRQYTEEWDLDRILRHTEEAVTFVVEHNLPCMYVTEDTTRAHPEALRKLYTLAIESGARRICLADTVGHATPPGVKNLVAFIRKVVDDTGEDVKIDWHGHNDRGLSVINAIAAIEAGVNRVHATALGIGERVGNCPMDILLVNLRLLGYIHQDLSQLSEYSRTVSKACGVSIPINYPVIGRDAFRTATGVHAAAVIKAEKKGEAWLADRIYSGVPAGLFGLSQVIEVGPMSGESNVLHWLLAHHLPQGRSIVEKILRVAKESDRVLEEDELFKLATG